MPSLDETGIKMADYMGQNAQVCQNNIYLLFVTCVSMSKARLSDLFGIRALFISTFPPEKKKKKKIRLYGNWRKWSLYTSLARQGWADPGLR